jgi:hypothetical protein
VSPTFNHGCPTIGVLAGWQYYWTATPLSYLNPIYRGIRQAAGDLSCNLLLGCGMGPSATSTDPLRLARPTLSSETDFVPIGTWNTDGLIAVNPLHTEARSRELQDLIAAGHPVMFVAAGEAGPTIVADNAAGIRDAMHHLHLCHTRPGGGDDHGHPHCGYERRPVAADRLVAESVQPSGQHLHRWLHRQPIDELLRRHPGGSGWQTVLGWRHLQVNMDNMHLFDPQTEKTLDL